MVIAMMMMMMIIRMVVTMTMMVMIMYDDDDSDDDDKDGSDDDNYDDYDNGCDDNDDYCDEDDDDDDDYISYRHPDVLIEKQHIWIELYRAYKRYYDSITLIMRQIQRHRRSLTPAHSVLLIAIRSIHYDDVELRDNRKYRRYMEAITV